MCGFAGCFDPDASATAEQLQTRVARMGAAVHHRGPDDDGVWVNASAGVGLAHRRLSIIDLSAAGHQPMASRCGRYHLVYNGEIYNYLELREPLVQTGVPFRGESDTEVLLEMIVASGIRSTLERVNGMFALALWDEQEQSLTLARDRVGIKPLYYGYCHGTLLFGSELKALRSHPDFDAAIDRRAVRELLEHGYIPAPTSIYHGVLKLPPGHLLSVKRRGNSDPRPEAYWSFPFTAGSETGDARMRSEQFATALNDSVRLRMLADVPVGAFLSGGIDSSLIVALMQSQSARPIRTFTIGFDEKDWNEAPYARRIAAHLGTDHTELIVSPQQARDVIPALPTIWDEPFADPSQIPTWLVCQLASQHVKVALSGDGGDELFGGYNRYRHIAGIWQKVRRVPRLGRNVAAKLLTNSTVQRLRGRSKRSPSLWQGVLAARSVSELYRHLHRHWPESMHVVIGDSESPVGASSGRQLGGHTTLDDDILCMMAIDSETYLPDDILAKVDRASMSVSLEARVPLLDHNVVEQAWRFPARERFTPAAGKLVLRELLQDHVPLEMFDRPKTGFGIPIDSWLRGPLRDWAETLLDEQRLHQEGYLRPEPIRAKWIEHCSGTADWHYPLWNVLMFQAWLEHEGRS